jgi:hypothetical protein
MKELRGRLGTEVAIVQTQNQKVAEHATRGEQTPWGPRASTDAHLNRQ